MLTRKSRVGWMVLGGLFGLFGIILACKMRDGNHARAATDPVPAPTTPAPAASDPATKAEPPLISDSAATPPTGALPNPVAPAPIPTPTTGVSVGGPLAAPSPAPAAAIPVSAPPAPVDVLPTAGTAPGSPPVAAPNPGAPITIPPLSNPLPPVGSEVRPVVIPADRGPAPAPGVVSIPPGAPTPPPAVPEGNPLPPINPPGVPVGSNPLPPVTGLPPVNPPTAAPVPTPAPTPVPMPTPAPTGSLTPPFAPGTPGTSVSSPMPTPMDAGMVDAREPATSLTRTPSGAPSIRVETAGRGGDPLVASTTLYKIRQNGENFKTLARKVLGTAERWGDIHKLNPSMKPDITLAVGTTVNLPSDATVVDDGELLHPLPSLRPQTAPKARDVLPLTGTYPVTLDERKVMNLPRAIVEQLGNCDTVLVSPGSDRCLWLTNQAHLDRLQSKLDKSPARESDVRGFKRLYYAQTVKLPIKDGRVSLSDKLAAFAALGQDLVLVGIDDHFEVWDAAKWRRFTATKRTATEE